MSHSEEVEVGAADVNKPDRRFNWQKNANKVKVRRCFDVSGRSWRKSKSKAAATGLKGTSVLMIHNVYGDKVRAVQRVRDTHDCRKHILRITEEPVVRIS